MEHDPFGLSPRDRALLDASINTPGGMTPRAPEAEGVYARSRGGSPFVFSNRAVVPSRGSLAVAAAQPFPILKMQGTDGMMRRWCVQVFSFPTTVTRDAVTVSGDFLRLAMTLGIGIVQVDVDIPAGSCGFECYAQAIDLFYVNNDNTVGAQNREVLATVSPVVAGITGVPGMCPTRTRFATVPAGIGNTPIVIPRFAVAVQFVVSQTSTTASRDYLFDYLDSYGTILYNGFTARNGGWMQIPMGAGIINFTSNPLVNPSVVAAIFRLGL